MNTDPRWRIANKADALLTAVAFEPARMAKLANTACFRERLPNIVGFHQTDARGVTRAPDDRGVGAGRKRRLNR